jgi:hypothetical protein
MAQFFIAGGGDFLHVRKRSLAATGALAKSGRSADATVSVYNITIIVEKSKAAATG